MSGAVGGAGSEGGSDAASRLGGLAGRPGARAVLVVGLLLLLVGLAWVAPRQAAPRAYVTGVWPIAIGTGAVLLAPARWRVAVAVAVGATGALSVVSGGWPRDVALGYAVTATVEVFAAARLLARGDGLRPRLRGEDDLRRYLATACAAALVAAAGVAATYALAGGADPGHAALGVGMSHLASHLCLVPLFLTLPTQGAIARRGERVTQWVTVLVAIPVLLLLDAAPLLIFLVIPFLAWAALRITPLEAIVQMLGVLSFLLVLTGNDAGPFADVPARYGLPEDFRGILLSAFCATCAVVVVPLVLRVGEYVGAARDSAAERDLVRGIVDGATGVAIVGTDPEGRITLFNPGAERLFGYRSEEVLGLRSRMLHTHDSVSAKALELGVRDDYRAVVDAVVLRGLVGTPIRFLRKDGVERTHAMTLTRLTVAGQTSGFVSTSEDITDQLDVESALRDALDADRRALDRLRSLDAVKQQFVSTVSHEIRTPITSILGYLEMLADGTLGPLDAAQSDALVRVQSNSDRLLTLVDDLLTLTKVGESGLRPDVEPFDLRAAVEAAHQVVAPLWTSRHLDVGLELPEEPVPVQGSRDMIERLVVNLLSNAVKFTEDGGTIGVSVRLDALQGHAVLRVTDTGIGIPLEEQEHLFTRFFRSSLAENRAIKGSGLGLSITRAIVEQHGGSIAITSAPARGTTVEVHLPARAGMSNIQLSL